MDVQICVFFILAWLIVYIREWLVAVNLQGTEKNPARVLLVIVFSGLTMYLLEYIY